jgi:hypothetical protein
MRYAILVVLLLTAALTLATEFRTVDRIIVAQANPCVNDVCR